CEKPLAMTHGQATEMFDAAEGHGRVLIEAFMYRCHPLTRAVKQALDAGEIGQLQIVRTSFCYKTRTIDGNVRFDPALGGGALMDIGCYCIDFAQHMVGERPANVSATGRIHA